MQNPTISIVIPMYNVEKYIATCIDSVLKQTLKDLEIIVIDDHSTDRSFNIAQKFLADPRVQIFQNPKRMHCDITRAIGMMRARGKYIYFMDADDAILPKMLETLVVEAEKSQAEVVLTNTAFTTADPFFKLPAQIEIKARNFEDSTPRFFSSNITDRLQHELFERSCYWEPWTRIQRRDFLLKHGITFPNTLRTGDLLFHLSEICNAEKIQVINVQGYIWRQHLAQTIRLPATEILKLGLQSFPAGLKYIRKIFESAKLLSNLSEDDKYYLELQAMIFYLTKTVNLANLSAMHVKSIVDEMVMKSDVCTPDFINSLLNVFLTQTVLINAQSKEIKSLKPESKSDTESEVQTKSESQTEEVHFESETQTENKSEGE